MSKRSDCDDEITSPKPQPYMPTCSRICTTLPCIAGPSTLPHHHYQQQHHRTRSSPPSSQSQTAPSSSLSSSTYSTPSSSYSPPSTTYSVPRKIKYAPDAYPRWNQSGRLDKGKRRVSENEEEHGEKSVSSSIGISGGGNGMIGWEAATAAAVHLGGGRHMMNYTGLRKKWSHDMVAKMRDDARRSNNASSPSSSLSSSSSPPLYSTGSAAQPRFGLARPRSRRDSMEPEARHPAQPFVAPRPLSVLDEQRMQDMKEKKREDEEKKGSKKKWEFMKRMWSGLERK